VSGWQRAHGNGLEGVVSEPASGLTPRCESEVIVAWRPRRGPLIGVKELPWGKDLGGLDLDQPDVLTQAEWESFAELHGGPLGYPQGLPALSLWKEFRPDLVKTHRMNMRHSGPHVPGRGTQVPFIPANLQISILDRYELGIELEFSVAKDLGWSRDEMMDVVAVATLDCPSRGYELIASPRVLSMLRSWPDLTADPSHFPDHWHVDRSIMTSGIKLSEPGMTDDELELLADWYRRVAGEVPPWLAFVGRFAPGLVKAHRIRWERALKVSPPAALPFYRLHRAVEQGDEDGIRENTLLGRAFGMTDSEIIDTITHGLLISNGPAGGSVVRRAVEDIVRT